MNFEKFISNQHKVVKERNAEFEKKKNQNKKYHSSVRQSILEKEQKFNEQKQVRGSNFNLIHNKLQ
ncbi:hypothetical protein [Oceanobacillus oncorhynchi]|uniref:hypothetical protein n=1 Tax=Oceanobacillus oncorhynchi TaxID=545501 RepID=UPI002F963A03